MNLTLKLSSNRVLILWQKPSMLIALSSLVQMSSNIARITSVSLLSRRMTKLGLSVRSFGRSRDNMSEDCIQRLCESRGETEYDHMKTRKKAVITLKPKLVCSNIKQITAASELRKTMILLNIPTVDNLLSRFSPPMPSTTLSPTSSVCLIFSA